MAWVSDGCLVGGLRSDVGGRRRAAPSAGRPRCRRGACRSAAVGGSCVRSVRRTPRSDVPRSRGTT